MSLIGKKIEEFSVPAYHNGELITVTDKDLEGKWSVLFFYPGDFTFVCPTELEDLALIYDQYQQIQNLFIRHGGMLQKQSKKLNIQ